MLTVMQLPSFDLHIPMAPSQAVSSPLASSSTKSYRHRDYYQLSGVVTHLKGMSSLSSSKLRTLPYHGQMMKIWLEYEMNPIRQLVPITLSSVLTLLIILPCTLPVIHDGRGTEQSQSQSLKVSYSSSLSKLV